MGALRTRSWLVKFARNLTGKNLLVGLAAVASGLNDRAQSIDAVDQFDPAGVGANNYADGAITKVWRNWFGDAFESLIWDSASDANTNSGSGSMKITAEFNGNDENSQWAVYDYNGTYPPVNGRQYTSFECDVRFAAGSGTTTNGGAALFGHLIFGVANGWGQDWFGGVDIPASNTNWVHVTLPIDAVSDPNLANIYNVIIHVYGAYYTPLNGASTCWVDNIEFFGPATTTTNCIVNWNDVRQRIDGFGASSGFRSSITTTQADLFFSTNTGVGLSLLKSVIVAGTTMETNIMQMAQARGARVWCTPYSPDAAFKDNDSLDGGSFLSASNQAYASELAGFVAGMEQNYGVNIYALSIQNEPDIAANYPSCLWTPQQIHDFVPDLQSALLASNVASTKIMLAEDDNWQTNYYLTAMSDPAVATKVGIIACHDYDGSPPSILPVALPRLANPNAAFWESEVSTYDSFDGSMTNAIYWANRIHLFMTVAGVNAFNYWWLMVDNGTDDNEGLTDLSGTPAKRLYVLGNYSRFIRPGFYRIGVTNNAQSLISAYKDPASGKFAIVAANSSFITVTQVFNLAAFTASSVTPWITSETLSLSSQPPVGITNSVFAYGLPPLSVVTFAGQSAGSTTCSLNASANPVLYGTPVVFTSVVSPTPPDGESVVFIDGITVLGTGILSSGVANHTNSQLAAGTHNLTAVFTAYGQSVTSSVVRLTVNALPVISVRQAGCNVILSWAQGTLLQATSIMGPWTTNLATSPCTNPMPSVYPQLFYRLLVQPGN
ncbi:MAG: Ig-like domain repeat protein [Verrucomicrobiota bacterium]